MTIDDPRFDLEGVLRQTAPQYGINFDHPAFNAGSVSEDKYKELLSYGLSADTGRIAPRAA